MLTVVFLLAYCCCSEDLGLGVVFFPLFLPPLPFMARHFPPGGQTMQIHHHRRRKMWRFPLIRFGVASFLVLWFLFLVEHTMEKNLYTSDARSVQPHAESSFVGTPKEVREEEEEEGEVTTMVMDALVPSDEATRLLFTRVILPQCQSRWTHGLSATSEGINYTTVMKLQRDRVASVVERNASVQSPSWWTYDDVFRDTVNPKYYVYEGGDVWDGDNIRKNPCDPLHVPFETARDASCIRMAQTLLHAAFSSPHNQGTLEDEKSQLGWHRVISLPHEAEVWIVGSDEEGKNRSQGVKVLVWVNIDPVAPSLDQRTIKFRASFCFFRAVVVRPLVLSPPPCFEMVSFILKVPQLRFPLEPFSEVGAFSIDRKLGVRRVPPTFLFPVPMAILQTAVARRSLRNIEMVSAFARGLEISTYDDWLQVELFRFLRKRSSFGGRREVFTRRGGADVWCSFQLLLTEVTSLLQGPLHVPYSKAKPGWHRWFNPLYAEKMVPYGSLAALSEQVMMDYILGNNDRSPNKNSFVVGGCRRCSRNSNKNIADPARNNKARRPSGIVPTIVHLDHGMAFHFGTTALVNNPLEKSGDKLTFCMFYRPLLFRLWNILKLLREENTNGVRDNSNGDGWGACGTHKDVDQQKLWAKFLMANISLVVRRAIGTEAFHASASRVFRLLQRADECLMMYPLAVVAIP